MKVLRKSDHYVTGLLLAPMALWMLLLLILPLIVVFIYSFGELAAMGGYRPAFTLAQYVNLPARLTAFKNTLMLAP
ncbi:MAG: ABC transporter permease, partial [Proteobacteria bacterium]|nr:ABC transporter permease [Pseudomonadota bacterium]